MSRFSSSEPLLRRRIGTLVDLLMGRGPATWLGRMWNRRRLVVLACHGVDDRSSFAGHLDQLTKSYDEPLIESFAATTAFTPDRPHSRSSLIPTECWNFPYLALARPDDGSAWLVYVEYVRGRPRVAGIGLDV